MGLCLTQHVQEDTNKDEKTRATKEAGHDKVQIEATSTTSGVNHGDERAPAKVSLVIVKSRKSAAGLPGRTPGT